MLICTSQIQTRNPVQAVTPTQTQQYFRLLDLPAEIRVKIYNYAIQPNKIITISTKKETYGRQRAVQRTTDNPDGESARRLPRRVALAQVSKQLAVETLPLIYGLPTFRFEHVEYLHYFLEDIGTAVKYLKNIHVTGGLKNFAGAGKSLKRLCGALALRSLVFSHRSVGDDGLSNSIVRLIIPEELVSDLLPLFRARQAIGSKGDKGIYEIVKVVEGERCARCAGARVDLCEEIGAEWKQETSRSRIFCGATEIGEQVRRMSQMITSAIARQLGTEEPAGNRKAELADLA